MKPTYVLAIGSFAVHGTASLKTFITILGERVLPVPSLLLNGLTNMSLVRKFEPPFHELLESTLVLAQSRDIDLILYIGYLGNVQQAGIIDELIEQYKAIIKHIIVDPVCGDHGRTYVPQEVIAQWPILIRHADIAFPNLTELKLLTGNLPDAEGELSDYADRFRTAFPKTKLVITSIKANENAIGIRSFGDIAFEYTHNVLPKNYGGSGDALLALFIKYFFFENLSFNEALMLSCDKVYQIIKYSSAAASTDLLLTAALQNAEL